MKTRLTLYRQDRRVRLFPLLATILFATSFVLAGCSGDGSNDDEFELVNGSMSAKIDGKQWHADLAITATHSGSIVAVGGSGGGMTIGFATFEPTGTLLIENGSGANGVYNEIANPNATWSATAASGSGSITLTTLTSEGASGTFAFEAVPSPNTTATGTKSITEGRFDVKFTIISDNEQ